MSAVAPYNHRTIVSLCESIRIVQLQYSTEHDIRWNAVASLMNEKEVSISPEDCCQMWNRVRGFFPLNNDKDRDTKDTSSTRPQPGVKRYPFSESVTFSAMKICNDKNDYSPEFCKIISSTRTISITHPSQRSTPANPPPHTSSLASIRVKDEKGTKRKVDEISKHTLKYQCAEPGCDFSCKFKKDLKAHNKDSHQAKKRTSTTSMPSQSVSSAVQPSSTSDLPDSDNSKLRKQLMQKHRDEIAIAFGENACNFVSRNCEFIFIKSTDDTLVCLHRCCHCNFRCIVVSEIMNHFRSCWKLNASLRTPLAHTPQSMHNALPVPNMPNMPSPLQNSLLRDNSSTNPTQPLPPPSAFAPMTEFAATCPLSSAPSIAPPSAPFIAPPSAPSIASPEDSSALQPPVSIDNKVAAFLSNSQQKEEPPTHSFLVTSYDSMMTCTEGTSLHPTTSGATGVPRASAGEAGKEALSQSQPPLPQSIISSTDYSSSFPVTPSLAKVSITTNISSDTCSTAPGYSGTDESSKIGEKTDAECGTSLQE